MNPLLEVSDLVVQFGRGRRAFRAVDEVSFSIERGETVALVGESGSGKTTIGRAIAGLARISGGSVRLAGSDITERSRRMQSFVAEQLQVVFQDPYSSLNPRLTIGKSLREPLLARGVATREEADARVASLLQRVGLPAGSEARLPNRFSGGQRQRIAIARALALDPALLICDEPTSALDVSTQARVLSLLVELQRDLGVGYLFITHDLAIVRRVADRVLVLRHGALVESGSVDDVCDRPSDPYTKQLIAAAPVPDPWLQRARRAQRSRLLVELDPVVADESRTSSV